VQLFRKFLRNGGGVFDRGKGILRSLHSCLPKGEKGSEGNEGELSLLKGRVFGGFAEGKSF